MTNASVAIAAFGALGDPTRRAIFKQLALQPVAVGQLAESLPVTRPAVSQHLKVLKDAGLVNETRDGTRRIYRLDPKGIGAMRDWLDAHWGAALDSFAQYVDDQAQAETPE